MTPYEILCRHETIQANLTVALRFIGWGQPDCAARCIRFALGLVEKEMARVRDDDPPLDDRIERPTAAELEQLLGASAVLPDIDLQEIPADPFLLVTTE